MQNDLPLSDSNIFLLYTTGTAKIYVKSGGAGDIILPDAE